MAQQRENFGSKMAVIMAMAGSAVGLGNIWRFPYIAGENGGAAFIIVYALASFLLALPIFLAESIIGRRSRANTFGAMKKLAPGTPWKWLGLITVLTPLLILGYYSVVGGWSVEYLFKALAFDFTGAAPEKIRSFFGGFISSTWEPLIMHTIFVAATTFIVLMGVKNGIEKFSKITMPALFVLIVAIAVYGITLPGAGKGVQYLLKPDFSKLTAGAVASAIGQAFFSLSLGVGTILVYASYMRKEESIFSAGVYTSVADLLFALIAGFAIMPAVFAAGIEPGAGPGLVFETLPFIFNQMGASAPWISATVAILFFVTILVAALTSSISLMEVGVTYLMEQVHIGRKKASVLVGLFVWVIGVICSLSFGPLSGIVITGENIFGVLDKLCSNWLMPFGGLLFTIFVGWRMGKADVRDEFTNSGSCNKGIFPLVWFLIRYAAPIGIVVVFITALVG